MRQLLSLLAQAMRVVVAWVIHLDGLEAVLSTRKRLSAQQWAMLPPSPGNFSEDYQKIATEDYQMIIGRLPARTIGRLSRYYHDQ